MPMPTIGVIPFDPGLVTQSVNFHGHNLLKQLVSENASQIHTIKLQDIDYKIYQSRTVELRNLGAARIKELLGFIASKSDRLLVAQSSLPKSKNKSSSYQDRYQHQLPYEYFMNVNKFIRVEEFMNIVEEGDILFTEVLNCSENTTISVLKVLAFDGGKHRYLTDLRSSDLKVILKREDTVVSKMDEDKFGKWLSGTRLRVEVLSSTSNPSPTLYVGTKSIALSSERKELFKLGKVQLKDLPEILSVTPDPNIMYLSQCIERMDKYKNPQCMKQMAAEMNIDLHWYPSLMASHSDVPAQEKCLSLRKAQMCKWAHKNVADGVTHFKKGQHEEAFQCLNKALQIDPENVEAFVAKGALLANLGRYEKAIEDFEKSLVFNPDHSNARKYMCETLVELGKQKEEKNNLNEAEKCYSRCLELNKGHIIAKEALESVKRKLEPESNILKLFKQEGSNPEEDFLADLLNIESELNRKKNEEEYLVAKIKKEEEEKEAESALFTKQSISEVTENSMEGSLSPLAQKLADQHNLWSHPPPSNSMDASVSSFTPSQLSLSTTHDMNIFSNPPPNWPVIDVSRPPPTSSVEYTEDSSYKARVEQFLKQLEIRSLGGGEKKRLQSREKSDHRKRNKHKVDKNKKRKRSSRSSSSSSNSSGSSSSSASTSGNSSSSTSSASSDNRKSSKSSKKQKKKQRKIKKTLKKMQIENKALVANMALPNFEDLEEKLLAYYKKMEAMNTPQELSKKTNEVEKVTNPVVNKLGLPTHPAFLEVDSGEDSPPKDAKLPSKNAPHITEKKLANKADIKLSSPSSFSSVTSRSRSYSSRSRSRSRNKRSRSRLRRKRSRSRSRSRQYRHKHRYSRSRSRNKYHRRSRSYSRSRSRGPYNMGRPRGKYFKWRPRSRSPFSYYKNKPFYSVKNRELMDKKMISSKLDAPPSPKPVPKPAPIKFELKRKIDTRPNIMADAKKQIQQHLSGNSKEFDSLLKKEEEIKNGNLNVEDNKPVASPDPSQRFGKWASEMEGQKDNKDRPVPKTPAPEGSLDQFENFLKQAKEKNMELMKERNKAFLKPNMD